MPEPHLLSPAGFRASAVHAGIKSTRKPDVALLICDRVAPAAAVFTTNKVVAAPVIVGRDHIRTGKLRGVVVNAGNANACTGKRGLQDARRMCGLAAAVAGCKAAEILPSSTGIIGHLLPMPKLERGISKAGENLGSSRDHANLFADAILTTDTVRKIAAVEMKIGRTRVTLAGVTKGSGMIGPRLSTTPSVPHATMLAYLTTDAAVPAAVLKKLLQQSADVSFNTVTVDDHASTNDTAVVLASGVSGAKLSSAADQRKFAAALTEVCQSLAYQIAADGEGASKVVIIKVRRAQSDVAAKAIARSIANSPLVKCAMNGNDPNWGRIVSAAGFANVPFDPDRCTLTLQGAKVFAGGTPVAFDTTRASSSLNSNEVTIDLDCRSGTGQATCWTCDLSKEYVAINADYHT